MSSAAIYILTKWKVPVVSDCSSTFDINIFVILPAVLIGWFLLLSSRSLICFLHLLLLLALKLPLWLSSKETSLSMQRQGFDPWVEEKSLERKFSVPTHSSILTWECLWTEETYGLQSMGLQELRYDLVIKQQQQLTAFSWVFTLATELSNFEFSSQFPISLLRWSAFLSIPFLGSSASLQFCLSFWSHGPADWRSLSHHLFLRNSCSFHWEWLLASFYLHLYDYESRRNRCLLWFWWVTLIWELPPCVFMSLVFWCEGCFGYGAAYSLYKVCWSLSPW